MSAPVALPGGPLAAAAKSGEPSPAVSVAVDALRLQAQCARALEAGGGNLRSLLDLLRKLLNAHATAWLENPAHGGRWPDAVVGLRSGTAAALVALRPTLDPLRAVASPAVHLGPDSYTLSAPVEHEGKLCGWLVAQIPVRNPRDLQAFLVLLQMASGYVLYGEQRRVGREVMAVLERASALLEILRTSGADLDFTQACRRAVDAMREEFGCLRVCLAFRHWGRLRVQTISGVSQVDWKSVSHHPMEAAMREAVAHAKPLSWSLDSPSLPATAAHEVLAADLGAARLLTLPLARGNGALLLAWTAGATPPGDRSVTAAAEFLPTFFDLLQRARPHPVRHAWRQGWQTLSRRKQQTALACAAGLTVLLALPFHYTLHVGCRLAPVTKQVVAAPFQAQLKRSLVRPGDRVVAGQPLGELDSRELKLKEAELLAAREHSLKQRDRAMANQGEGSDYAAAQVANFEAQSVAEELALVQRKLSLLNVRAPLAGTVVSGDLRRAEGQPVQQGQILWEVAPLEEMIVELEVPDRDVAHVREGQRVALRLDSASTNIPATALQRLHPQSEPSEGQNVFIGEAPVRPAHPGVELRPGMRGRATIETARRPLIWILGHRLWEWAVTTLFW